jgi:hypothetical protein
VAFAVVSSEEKRPKATATRMKTQAVRMMDLRLIL